MAARRKVAARPKLLLGAHTSIAGGTAEAPPRARAVGATAMQIFTKMASRWAERVCEGDECEAFRAALQQTDVAVTTAHDSYLINCASPDDVLRQHSIDSLVWELQRCDALGLDFLVSHPGNYMDDRDSGIARNAESIGVALERAKPKVRLLMELTAGSGTVLGSTFEEMAALLAQIPLPYREAVGVCFDTAHVFASGYDLVGDYAGVWARFDDTIGLERLGFMHLNDSKVPLGSKRDRHELIAEGAIGEGPFRKIMNDPALARVPKVIETPKLDDHEATDRRMLELLKSYID
jgi:apurinic endonuclease (APN1)